MGLGDTIETVFVTGGGYVGIAKINRADFDPSVHTPVNNQGSRIDFNTGVVLSKDEVEALEGGAGRAKDEAAAAAKAKEEAAAAAKAKEEAAAAAAKAKEEAAAAKAKEEAAAAKAKEEAAAKDKK